MDAETFQKIYKAKKPDKSDSNIVFHCKAGIRSKAALEAVQQIGYKKYVKKYLLVFLRWVIYTESKKDTK